MSRGRTSRRRAVGLVVVVVVALVVGVAATVLASVGAGERVTSLWVAATLAPDGSAQVVEVVDYDFGGSDRHGIYRTVPGLRTSVPVEVSSPDAPDDVVMETPTRIRVGDPDETVSGQHRYVLRYTLDGVALDGRFAWDAVGTEWEAPIEHAEIHVAAPNAFGGPGCVTGESGSTARCSVGSEGSGELVADVDDLGTGEGVTVSATLGEPLSAAPALPEPPAPVAATRDGAAPSLVGLVAGALALAAGLLTVLLLRRAGREHVPATGMPSSAGPGEQARIDLEELGRFATASPELPRRLSAPEGGVLLADGVRPEHKAAWLVEQAVAGTVELAGDGDWGAKDLTLVRLAPGERGVRDVLDTAFRGRSEIRLGRYDEDFAAGWNAIGGQLSEWQRSSGLWDRRADGRTVLVRTLGALVGLLGVGLVLLGGWLSADAVAVPLLLVAAGGVLAGAGGAAAVRGWELKVLTPEGSAAWLQVESLRQFLAQSPPEEIDRAVAEGRLGTYTAWALALGEAQRWKQLASATAVPGRRGYHGDPYYRYAVYSPVFVSSCSTASTAPSSSSSGGSGSVGGGAGGGGGGSW